MLSREWRIGLGPGGVVFFVKLAQLGRTLQWDANCVPKQSVERIDPEHLAGKHGAEIARDGFGDGVQVQSLPSSCCIEVTGFAVMPQGMIRLK